MKKVSIIGHFGFGVETFDGQTIKTKVVANQIKKWFGEKQVCLHDTHGGIRFLLMSPFVTFKQLLEAENIIIMPGENGLRIIPLLLTFFNVLFSRKLYYVVIGGWLSTFAQKHKHIAKQLKKFEAIYVETERLKKSLEDIGFCNIRIMPNAKELHILTEDDIQDNGSCAPYRFCIFSRIIESKGIKDAIDAIEMVNRNNGETIALLDIYGHIEEVEWFNELESHFPDYIKYCGKVPFSQSVETIKGYYALLFPTYYEGECFPGTLIDAMAAGVPVIASDWHDNPSIVINGVTGLVYETRNVEKLAEFIKKMIDSPKLNREMRLASIKQAEKYLPVNAFDVLKSDLMK